MSALWRSIESSPYVSDDLRELLRRRCGELAGLGLLAGGGVLGTALATWSVQDPSLTHATKAAAVRNVLGSPGAAVSDLLMQLLGLASIAFLLPLAVWGWRLMTHRPLGRERLRVGFWLLAIVAGAAFASCLPTTRRWPLPTGLGGVFGDALLALPGALFGRPLSLPALIVVGACAGALMLAALAGAFGLAFKADPKAKAAALARRRIEDAEEDDAGEGRGWMLGWVAHAFLSAHARAGRLAGSLRSRLAASEDAQPAARRLRIEPRWQDAPAVRAVREPAPALVPDGPAAKLPASGGEQRRKVAVGAPMDRSVFEPDDSDDAMAAPAGGFPNLDDDEDMPQAAPRPRAAPPRAEMAAAKPAPISARPLAKGAPAKNGRGAATDRRGPHGGYELPPLNLLALPKPVDRSALTTEQIQENAATLEGVLDDFGVRGEIINARPGPVVTMYELEPAPGIKSSRVIGLADDIARSMSAVSARVAVVPGRNVIGIELPNPKREKVYLRELLSAEDYGASSAKLPLCLGKTIGGEPVIVDLARMPHLLIAGTTGSGKSVAINTMILSLLYRLNPDQCRLIMVDPKMLELSVYDGIPHLLTPVVTDPKKAVVALKWAVREMEDRYRKMSKLGVRNVEGYNARVAEAKAKGESLSRTVHTGYDKESGEAIYEEEALDLETLPFLVVIVDEMADLMMVAGKEIEGAIQRLAQMARAAGIHVILATQRPSVDVITGTIKANFPTRISFQVTSKIDSRTILGEQGAEQLLGQGDMLYMAGGGRISRVHGPFCSDEEVEKCVRHLKSQGAPQYVDAVTAGDAEDDEEEGAVFDATAMGGESGDPYAQAVQVVMRDRKASTSYIQRRLQIGYNRAASIMERMEKEGIVGQANHAGKREILVGGDDN